MSERHTIMSILEEAFNIVSEPIIAVDETGEPYMFNSAAQKLRAISDGVGCQSLSNFLKNFMDMDADKNHEMVELNGRVFNCHSLKIRKTDFKGFLLLFKEVTDVDEIKTQLTEAYALKDELDAVIQASFDYIFVTDGDGNVLKINDAYTRITGLSKEEVLGKNIYDLVKQGYYDRAATIDILETRESTTFVQTIKTGKTVLVTGNPVFNHSGELVRVVTNGRDITELNRLKKQVEHAESLGLHYQKELHKIKLEGGGDYIVASPQMLEINKLLKRISQVDSTVIIYGESGVGKEIVAREIHRNSKRSDQPYICINSASIQENLLESELFGYEAGAFTGAKRGGKMGIFQLANGGTLFLDEIGEIPYHLQAKLLRVIQENEIMRIGGSVPIPIDVRIITATNRNLWQMVKDGEFREDFYYRLNVVQVKIPPLRKRKQEIPVFADYFIGMLNKKYKLNKRLDPMMEEWLYDYEWPGNIRELRNAIEQAFVTSPGELISRLHLGPEESICSTATGYDEDENDNDNAICLGDAMRRYEKKLINTALDKYGSTRKAAAALGVSQTTIWRKARDYGIDLS